MNLQEKDPYYMMLDAIDKALVTGESIVLVVKQDNGELNMYSPWEIEVTEAIGLLTAAAIKVGVHNGIV